jgi:hypothetical protein
MVVSGEGEGQRARLVQIRQPWVGSSLCVGDNGGTQYIRLLVICDGCCIIVKVNRCELWIGMHDKLAIEGNIYYM